MVPAETKKQWVTCWVAPDFQNGGTVPGAFRVSARAAKALELKGGETLTGVEMFAVAAIHLQEIKEAQEA